MKEATLCVKRHDLIAGQTFVMMSYLVTAHVKSHLTLARRAATLRALVPTPIEPVYATFGQLVRENRTRRRLSQEQLGRALHPPLTRASIANIETGKQRVLLHTALEVAATLGFQIEEIVAEASPPTTLDPGALVAELASKLPITTSRARSLASRISPKNKKVNP